MVAHHEPDELPLGVDEVLGDGVVHRHPTVVVLQVRRVRVGAEVAPPAEVRVAEVAVVRLARIRVDDARVDLAADFGMDADRAAIHARRHFDPRVRSEVERPDPDGALFDDGVLGEEDRPVRGVEDRAGADRRAGREVDPLGVHEHGAGVDRRAVVAREPERVEVGGDPLGHVVEQVPEPADELGAVHALLGHPLELEMAERLGGDEVGGRVRVPRRDDGVALMKGAGGLAGLGRRAEPLQQIALFDEPSLVDEEHAVSLRGERVDEGLRMRHCGDAGHGIPRVKDELGERERPPLPLGERLDADAEVARRARRGEGKEVADGGVFEEAEVRHRSEGREGKGDPGSYGAAPALIRPGRCRGPDGGANRRAAKQRGAGEVGDE